MVLNICRQLHSGLYIFCENYLQNKIFSQFSWLALEPSSQYVLMPSKEDLEKKKESKSEKKQRAGKEWQR